MWLRFVSDGKVVEISEVTAADLNRILVPGSVGDCATLIASRTSFIRASIDAKLTAGRDAVSRRSDLKAWVLEYHDGASGRMFRAAERVELAYVRRGFRSYLAESAAWHQAFDWRELQLQAEIRETDSELRAVFTWWGLEDARTMPLVEVTLECGTFRATAIISNHSIAEPLLRFLKELGSLSGDWTEERRFVNCDENFRIAGLFCQGGKILVEVTIDADSYDPTWTVQLRMIVDLSAWAGIIQHFRNYFSTAEGSV